MPLDKKKLEKPLVKLRKMLRNISKVPTQNEVHDIRTNTRRVEATVGALQLDRRRKGRRLLRAVTPVRKKAGRVRDVDVLTGFAAKLSTDGDDSCLVRLLEHLGEKRARTANKLRRSIVKRTKVIGERLKTCAAFIEKGFNQRNSSKEREWPIDAAVTALRLSGELADWPRLTSDNLHAFRLKVKEMRYVLQLSGQDSELVKRLGQVKDQIGEWHDWVELNAVARKTLSDCKKCRVVTEIEQTAKHKFEHALRTSQRLQRNYFARRELHFRRNRQNAAVGEHMLEATAKLAA